MLNAALTFLVFALIAGVLGFSALEGAAATIAKFLFIGFLVVALLGLLAGRRVRV